MSRDQSNGIDPPPVKTKPLAIAPPYVLFSWQAAGPDDAAPVRLVLVGINVEGEPTRLVETARFAGGRRFLAGIADRRDRVLSWLELWVQYPTDLVGTPAALCGLLNNERLDAEWERTVKNMTELAPESIVDSGWAAFPLTALAVDVQRRGVVPLGEPASGAAFKLCRDDERLRAAKLAPYRSTLERWFEAKEPGVEPRWCTLAQVNQPEHLRPRADPGAPGETGALLAVNPAAGGMLLREFSFLTLDGVIRRLALSTAPKAETGGVGESEDVARDLALLEARLVDEHATSIPRSKPYHEEENALESLYGRLELWHQLVREVYRHSDRQGVPMLNISGDSFRVRVGVAEDGISPFRLQAQLVQPGDAIRYEASATQHCFVPVAGFGAVELADGFGGWKAGSGNVRMNQLIETADGVKLEGFVEAAGLRGVALPPMLWLVIPVAGTDITFMAALESEQVGPRASVRFRALVRDFPAEALKRLKSGVTSRLTCRYFALRPMDPAIDIHALGLLGVHLLLGNETTRADELEDDLFDLATLLPAPCDVSHLKLIAESPGISERIVRLLAPAAWITAGNSSAIPADLWLAVIRTLTEFVTVEENLERAFTSDAQDRTWLEGLNRRLVTLGHLVHHTRGLIATPRAAHEEIARAVYRFVRSDR